MFRTYIKIALRSLRKNRMYAFVNIAGLAIGITCCILIGLYVTQELSYDRFNVNADRIVRATMEYSFNDGKVTKTAFTGTKPGPQLKRIFPDVEAYARLYKKSQVVGYESNQFEEKNFLYADSVFFQVFSFPLIKGNASTALDGPNKVVFTESAAKKYFGSTDPLGKTVRVGSKDYMVTGVAANAPGASQIQFDFVASFSNLGVSKSEEWFSANYFTYFLLNNPKQVNNFQKQVTAYLKTVSRDELKATGSDYLTYSIEPLKRVHLYSSLEGLEPNGNILYVYILGVIAILILCIACVNYTNLATAQATSRSTEIGIRKVMGAQRAQLFRQFIGESFILTLLAFLVALAASTLLMPVFNDLTGKSLQVSTLFQPLPILLFLGLSLLISLAAGAYPAILLSGYKMINILKAGITIAKGNSNARKSLIVFQFIISLFLVISTIVIIQQLNYIRNKNLGYNKEHLVILPIDGKMQPHVEEIKNAMLRNPKVLHVSGAYESPTYIQWGDGLEAAGGAGGKEITVNAFPVDLDIVNTLGLQLVAGTDFTRADLQLINREDQSKSRYTYMLNEAACKALGWTPQEAIGRTVSKGTPGEVKAVVKDFHYASLHDQIGSLVIFLDPTFANELLVKISGDNIPATLKQLETVWKERVPHRPFEYHFLDEEYASLYKTEMRTGQLFSTFSSLAILLACLGLFALAAYSTVKRTKEIGIRKVLGATVTNITVLLSKDFLKLVLIALVIASPIAWYAAHQWLNDFVYRISIQWWIFGLAGIMAILIALVTVGFHAIKASLSNPVKSLRSE
jgi:putative ABC transport system permease protein